MSIITDKIKNKLEEKNLSQLELAKLIDYNRGALGHMINNDYAFPDHVIEKISPILEVSVDEIKSWILADKYPKEVLELAIGAKKSRMGCQPIKKILTAKLDEVLQSKKLSRTALSKLINYSQGGLNEMIIGKEPMSKSVISKISLALDIPENEIKSWVVADKYSIESLDAALKEL